MTLDDVRTHAARTRLMVMGAFHPGPEDRAPEGTGTLILLGPSPSGKGGSLRREYLEDKDDGFWAHVTASPEFEDGLPDPLDRWSERVIGGIADTLGARAFFPFGGAPYLPFFSWAVASGAAWASPVKLLVQAKAGLMVSYRGALAFSERLELGALPEKPCDGCTAPCGTACPVGALTPAGYDVPACHAYLATEAGRDCLMRGCAVRRACPVSEAYGRSEAQSAYHMGLFHR